MEDRKQSTTCAAYCVSLGAIAMTFAAIISGIGGGDLKVKFYSRVPGKFYKANEESISKKEFGDFSVLQWSKHRFDCLDIFYVHGCVASANESKTGSTTIQLENFPLRFIVLGCEAVAVTLSVPLLFCLRKVDWDEAYTSVLILICMLAYVGFAVEASFATGIGLGQTHREYFLFIRSDRWVFAAVLILIATVLYTLALGLVLRPRSKVSRKVVKEVKQKKRQDDEPKTSSIPLNDPTVEAGLDKKSQH